LDALFSLVAAVGGFARHAALDLVVSSSIGWADSPWKWEARDKSGGDAFAEA
jgi:hypothetical protein